MQGRSHRGNRFGLAAEQDPQHHEQTEQQHAGGRGNDPDRNADAAYIRRQRLALPMRREIARHFWPNAPRSLVKVALDLLKIGKAAGGGSVHALETECEAGVLQLEHRIVEQWIKFIVVENFEKPHAANALPEKAA